jgi:uncharacterized lipoprotein YmbA
MKVFLVRSWLGVLILAASLAACVSLEKSYPDKRYFVLEAGGRMPTFNPSLAGILQVANVRVSPRYEDRLFVYRISDASYEADFYNQFLIAPAALIAQEMRRELARSQLFRHVIGASSQLEPTHVLECMVDALYGDFRDPSAPKAVIEMEVFLSKEAGNKAEIVAAKRYAKAVAISGRSPEALVKGWNEALEAILSALAADLKAAEANL